MNINDTRNTVWECQDKVIFGWLYDAEEYSKFHDYKQKPKRVTASKIEFCGYWKNRSIYRHVN